MNTKITSFPRRSFIAGAAALGAMTLANPSFALADEITDKQAEADTALASLKAMQASLDQASDDYTTALQEQEDAETKRDEAQVKIDEQNEKISALQERLGTRARSMYRNGSSTFLEVLTGAATFADFATGLDLLSDMNEEDAQLVEDVKTERQVLQEAKDEYSAQAETARQKAEEAAQVQAEAEATVAEMQAYYDSLSAEVAELVEQKRAAEEAAAAAAAAAVVQASADEGAANESSGGGSSSSGGSSYYDDDDDDSGSSSGGVYEGGSDAVSRAYSCLGAPYVWGAVGPSSYDCSGLVSYCITGRHARVFTSSSLMGYSAVSNPSPGDVAVKSGHCGIYIGGGQMIHAADYGIGVIVGSVQSGMKIVRP